MISCQFLVCHDPPGSSDNSNIHTRKLSPVETMCVSSRVSQTNLSCPSSVSLLLRSIGADSCLRDVLDSRYLPSSHTEIVKVVSCCTVVVRYCALGDDTHTLVDDALCRLHSACRCDFSRSVLPAQRNAQRTNTTTHKSTVLDKRRTVKLRHFPENTQL